MAKLSGAAPAELGPTAWAVVFLLAGAAPGCLLAPEATECASAASCATCLGRSGCGWCAEDGVCRPGSSFGADHGVCRSDRWRYSSCEGPIAPVDPCAGRSYCSTCRDEAECGWCFDGEGACLQGDASGPSAGECAAWSYEEADGDCYRLECYAAQTCGDCLGRNCYWCSAGSFCEYSTDDYCRDDYRVSPYGDDTCPANEGCYMASGCEACVAIPGCRYCYDYYEFSDRYEGYGCFADGHCPSLAEYSAGDEDPRQCPSRL